MSVGGIGSTGSESYQPPRVEQERKAPPPREEPKPRVEEEEPRPRDVESESGQNMDLTV